MMRENLGGLFEKKITMPQSVYNTTEFNGYAHVQFVARGSHSFTC